jgi:2-polyprenyl-3-methyl-5-hydroxy-6-metoxy-1,4-benzoquinol methylase
MSITRELSEFSAAISLDRLPAEVVDRAGLILDLVRGKSVLDVGASGPMAAKIREVATAYVGLDRTASDGVQAFDLDDVRQLTLPQVDGVTVVVCGEVLEHLANPGHFLTRLARQYPGVPVVVSVPNAFTEAGRQHMLKGIENINLDHVAWYSYHTLRTLLTRCGYRIASFVWYHGQPHTAEGLVVLAETLDG